MYKVVTKGRLYAVVARSRYLHQSREAAARPVRHQGGPDNRAVFETRGEAAALADLLNRDLRAEGRST